MVNDGKTMAIALLFNEFDNDDNEKFEVRLSSQKLIVQINQIYIFW